MTCWLLPGSLTVVNCSSLYFSNAGASLATRPGSEIVRALMSGDGLLGQRSVQGKEREGRSTCYDVCELSRRTLMLAQSLVWRGSDLGSFTSPGGAPSTKDSTVARFDMVKLCGCIDRGFVRRSSIPVCGVNCVLMTRVVRLVV
jgi:hypothetical protein